jgi:Superinfection immunity protein
MIAVAGLTTAAGTELGWGLIAATAVYFAPTVLALARHRGAAPLTFSLNLLLGWTGIGWFGAWLLALADRRLHVHVTSQTTVQHPQPPAFAITFAPDGRHWWDGSGWRDGWRVAPSGALRSPDGSQWFTGSQWIPEAVALAALAGPPPTPAGASDPVDEPPWWPNWESNRPSQ